jgi:hypothetical protein
VAAARGSVWDGAVRASAAERARAGTGGRGGDGVSTRTRGCRTRTRAWARAGVRAGAGARRRRRVDAGAGVCERARAGGDDGAGRAIDDDGVEIRQPAGVPVLLVRWSLAVLDVGRKEKGQLYTGGALAPVLHRWKPLTSAKAQNFSTGSCQEPVLKVLLLGTAPPPPLAPV